MFRALLGLVLLMAAVFVPFAALAGDEQKPVDWKEVFKTTKLPGQDAKLAANRTRAPERIDWAKVFGAKAPEQVPAMEPSAMEKRYRLGGADVVEGRDGGAPQPGAKAVAEDGVAGAQAASEPRTGEGPAPVAADAAASPEQRTEAGPVSGAATGTAAAPQEKTEASGQVRAPLAAAEAAPPVVPVPEPLPAPSAPGPEPELELPGLPGGFPAPLPAPAPDPGRDGHPEPLAKAHADRAPDRDAAPEPQSLFAPVPDEAKGESMVATLPVPEKASADKGGTAGAPAIAPAPVPDKARVEAPRTAAAPAEPESGAPLAVAKVPEAAPGEDRDEAQGQKIEPIPDRAEAGNPAGSTPAAAAAAPAEPVRLAAVEPPRPPVMVQEPRYSPEAVDLFLELALHTESDLAAYHAGKVRELRPLVLTRWSTNPRVRVLGEAGPIESMVRRAVARLAPAVDRVSPLDFGMAEGAEANLTVYVLPTAPGDGAGYVENAYQGEHITGSRVVLYAREATPAKVSRLLLRALGLMGLDFGGLQSVMAAHGDLPGEATEIDLQALELLYHPRLSAGMRLEDVRQAVQLLR